MDATTTHKGLIIGMEKLGATYVKTDEKYIYFSIPKGGELDNEEKLQRAKSVFRDSLGLGLKINKVQ